MDSHQLFSPAFQRTASFDGFECMRPLINLDAMMGPGKSPNPYKFEITPDVASSTQPMQTDGPMIDFDSVNPDEACFILGALPLIVPADSNMFEDDRFRARTPVPPPVQQEALPAISKKEEELPQVVVESAKMETEPVPAKVETKTDVPTAQPLVVKRAKANKSGRKSTQLATQLRTMLQEHSDKMDLSGPLSEIAGLPVKLKKDAATGELSLGKYTLAQRKIRLEAFKKKFAHRRPIARKGNKPRYASRSRFAKSRKRVGGRFVKRASSKADDDDAAY
jgi:hypothetical protein